MIVRSQYFFGLSEWNTDIIKISIQKTEGDLKIKIDKNMNNKTVKNLLLTLETKKGTTYQGNNLNVAKNKGWTSLPGPVFSTAV